MSSAKQWPFCHSLIVLTHFSLDRDGSDIAYDNFRRIFVNEIIIFFEEMYSAYYFVWCWELKIIFGVDDGSVLNW